MRRQRAWLVLGLLGGLATGCGPGNNLTLGRVQGRITYMGEPVQWGRVLFMPDASQGTEGPSAMSLIARDGTYSMATESADDGAIVGVHKVGIVGLDPTPLDHPNAEDNDDRDLEKVFTTKAEQVQASRRRKAARSGADERTMTTVDGKTYRIVVPEKVLKPDSSGITVEVSRGTNRVDFDVKEDGSVEILRR